MLVTINTTITSDLISDLIKQQKIMQNKERLKPAERNKRKKASSTGQNLQKLNNHNIVLIQSAICFLRQKENNN